VKVGFFQNPETDTQFDLIPGNLAVLNVAANLLYLEPVWILEQVWPARSMALSMACCTPS
tara:strand:- start:41 stop:220 length:180 start_codon:yes stop_codon:yes gene_type:complete